jgi:hypothetical protein
MFKDLVFLMPEILWNQRVLSNGVLGITKEELRIMNYELRMRVGA